MIGYALIAGRRRRVHHFTEKAARRLRRCAQRPLRKVQSLSFGNLDKLEQAISSPA